MTQPAQDTTSLWKVPSVLLIVAGHKSDSSVRHLVSEGMNTESAAELHLAFFSWSLAVDEGTASTLAHLLCCDSQVPVDAPASVLLDPQAKKQSFCLSGEGRQRKGEGGNA